MGQGQARAEAQGDNEARASWRAVETIGRDMSRKKKQQPDPTFLRKWLVPFVTFVGGILFALVFDTYFVALLPAQRLTL
jgi:hypothetical protein